MKVFDNDIQIIKYEVIREVVKLCIKGTLKKDGKNLFKVLVPGPKARTRCCIHKESGPEWAGSSAARAPRTARVDRSADCVDYHRDTGGSAGCAELSHLNRHVRQ